MSTFLDINKDVIMGESLGNIKSCCIQLEERAVKTRSVAADRLCALLSNPRICAQVDEAARVGGARDWGWQVGSQLVNTVILVLTKYLAGCLQQHLEFHET